MECREDEKEWSVTLGKIGSIRENKCIKSGHMQSIREKITFISSAILYLLFNLKIAASWQQSMMATLLQVGKTAPVNIGLTWVIVAFMQYIANGKKMPWERRVRIFFAVGIISGLLYAIYEYTGVPLQ